MYYLYFKHFSRINGWRISALLLLSFLAFQSNTFANNLEKTAQDYRAKGYEEQQKGRFDKALAFYQKALTLGLENEVLYNDMGVLFDQMDNPQKARLYYLKALNLNPDYLPPYTNLAFLYKELGDTQNAAHFFEERYRRAPEGDLWKEEAKRELLEINPGLREQLVNQEAQQMEQVLIQSSREEFRLQIERAEKHYQKGQQYLEEKLWDDALNEYDHALNLTPDNPKVLEGKERALYAKSTEEIKRMIDAALIALESGDGPSAQKIFQEILAIFPEATIQKSE